MTSDRTDLAPAYSIAVFDRADPATAMMLRRGVGDLVNKGFGKWLADPACGRYLFADLHCATMAEKFVNFDDEARLIAHIVAHCRKLTAAAPARRFKFLASPALLPKLEGLRQVPVSSTE